MTLELLDTTLIQSCNNQSTEGHKSQQKSKYWKSLKQNSDGTDSQSSKKEELEFYTDLTDHFDFQIHDTFSWKNHVPNYKIYSNNMKRIIILLTYLKFCVHIFKFKSWSIKFFIQFWSFKDFQQVQPLQS